MRQVAPAQEGGDVKVWKDGAVESVDRFARICRDNANDNAGFLRAIAEEYGIKPSDGAANAFRSILSDIADDVYGEVIGDE